MTRRRVLVTGASGMVGSWVTRRASELGYQVKAMVRPTSNRRVFEGLDAELVEADLAKPETLPAALADVDMVVHTAAHIGDWGPAETYRAINVYALEQMLTIAQRQRQFDRWVQISSLGIYPPRHHYGTDETMPSDLQGLDGYTRTKAEAEVVLHRHMEQHGFPAVILRPGFMYGAGDRHVVPRIIERIAAGQMRLVGEGKRVIDNTFVGNLVDAIMLALETDEALGETFNICDERLVTREEFVGAIADYLGKPRPKKVPEWFARSAVGIIEGLAKARGATTAPLLTRARLKFLTLNLEFSIEKAREKLRYQPRIDFQQGMREALDWAQQAGLISEMKLIASKT